MHVCDCVTVDLSPSHHEDGALRDHFVHCVCAFNKYRQSEWAEPAWPGDRAPEDRRSGQGRTWNQSILAGGLVDVRCGVRVVPAGDAGNFMWLITGLGTGPWGGEATS